ESQETRVSLLFDLLRHLLRHHGSGGVAANRIFEYKSVIEFDCADERNRFLKISLSFPGKTDNKIRRDAHLRLSRAQLFDNAQEALARITTVHRFEHPIAAALHWNM